jgi:transposase
VPRPPRPRRPPGGGRQPAPRASADRVPRRGRSVRRHRQPDQPDVPGPFPHPGRRRRALAKRLAAWLASVGYSGRTPAATLHHLGDAPPGATASHRHALAGITNAYLAVLATISTQIQALARQITQALHAHPDHAIFTSLPRAGTVRAARLLTEIGDARGRFPTPARWPAWPASHPPPASRANCASSRSAGPWTNNSATAVCDFAGDSRHTNPWAAELYNRARARGHDHPHAVRILARSWLNIIWKCWTANTPYHPDRHRALQQLTKPDQTGKIKTAG